MTCIVGYIDQENRKMYLGGDRAMSCGDYKMVSPEAKVFDLGGFLIGFAGTVTIIQAIQSQLVFPDLDSDMDFKDWSYNDFFPRVRELIKNLEFPEGVSPEFELIILYNGVVYEYDKYGTIITCEGESFQSIGNGCDHAIGAMAILDRIKSLSPENKIKQALKVSSKYIAGVSPPFDIVTLEY